MDARLGLKQFPDGPSLVRSIAKAPARIALVAVRARSIGFVGYASKITAVIGGYGGYATYSIHYPQTGLRFNT